MTSFDNGLRYSLVSTKWFFQMLFDLENRFFYISKNPLETEKINYNQEVHH